MLSVPARTARRDLTFLLVGAVAGTVAALSAGYVATYRASGSPSLRVAVFSSPPALDQPAAKSAPDSRIGELETKLSEAQAEIETLHADRTREWKQTTAFIEAILDSDTTEEIAAARSMRDTLQKMRRRFAAHDGKLDIFGDHLYAALFAQVSGPASVRELLKSLQDTSIDLELRKKILEMIVWLPAPATIDVLLQLPPDLASEFDPKNSLDMFAMLAGDLPTDQVSRHIPQFYDLATQTLEQSPKNGSAWDMIGVLALNHNFAPAKAMLNSQNNFQYYGEELLTMAWWIGSDESRSIIEQIGRSHPDPKLRAKANGILSNW